MTKRKHPLDLRRPRRLLGERLRLIISCPGCGGDEIAVVAYRTHTVRFMCESCALRFSLKPLDVASALMDHAEAFAENADAESRMGFLMLAVAREGDEWLRSDQTEEELRRGATEALQWFGYELFQMAAMRPGESPERRKQRAAKIEKALVTTEEKKEEKD
jgi:hypothetical protein